MTNVKTCSCTLPHSDPTACDRCPVNYQNNSLNFKQGVLNINDYDIDFGDDFILLRKRKV